MVFDYAQNNDTLQQSTENTTLKPTENYTGNAESGIIIGSNVSEVITTHFDVSSAPNGYSDTMIIQSQREETVNEAIFLDKSKFQESTATKKSNLDSEQNILKRIDISQLQHTEKKSSSQSVNATNKRKLASSEQKELIVKPKKLKDGQIQSEVNVIMRMLKEIESKSENIGKSLVNKSVYLDLGVPLLPSIISLPKIPKLKKGLSENKLLPTQTTTEEALAINFR